MALVITSYSIHYTKLYDALRDAELAIRTLARRVSPVWVYVSATGVAVYLLLYQVAPRLGG